MDPRVYDPRPGRPGPHHPPSRSYDRGPEQAGSPRGACSSSAWGARPPPRRSPPRWASTWSRVHELINASRVPLSLETPSGEGDRLEPGPRARRGPSGSGAPRRRRRGRTLALPGSTICSPRSRSASAASSSSGSGSATAKPRTLSQKSADELSLSRERVRQIEAKTLAKLRSFRDAQKLCATRSSNGAVRSPGPRGNTHGHGSAHRQTAVADEQLDRLREVYRGLGPGFPAQAQSALRPGRRQRRQRLVRCGSTAGWSRCLSAASLASTDLFLLPSTWEIMRAEVRRLASQARRRHRDAGSCTAAPGGAGSTCACPCSTCGRCASAGRCALRNLLGAASSLQPRRAGAPGGLAAGLSRPCSAGSVASARRLGRVRPPARSRSAKLPSRSASGAAVGDRPGVWALSLQVVARVAGGRGVPRVGSRRQLDGGLRTDRRRHRWHERSPPGRRASRRRGCSWFGGDPRWRPTGDTRRSRAPCTPTSASSAAASAGSGRPTGSSASQPARRRGAARARVLRRRRLGAQRRLGQRLGGLDRHARQGASAPMRPPGCSRPRCSGADAMRRGRARRRHRLRPRLRRGPHRRPLPGAARRPGRRARGSRGAGPRRAPAHAFGRRGARGLRLAARRGRSAADAAPAACSRPCSCRVCAVWPWPPACGSSRPAP